MVNKKKEAAQRFNDTLDEGKINLSALADMFGWFDETIEIEVNDKHPTKTVIASKKGKNE